MKNALHILKMMGLVIIILSAPMFLHAEEPSSLKDWSVSSVSEDPKLEITIRGYPDTVQFGDSIYLICIFKNVGDQVIDNIMVNFQYDRIDIRRNYFRSHLSNDENGQEIYNLIYEDFNGPHSDRGRTPTVSLHPGESHVMYVHSFEVPPLEDIHAPFWKNMLMSASGIDKKYTLRMSMQPPFYGPAVMERTLSHDIRVKQRSEAEMALLDSWLSQSTERNLPMVWINDNGYEWYKHPYRETSDHPSFSDYNNNHIVVKDQEYNPWWFIRPGNRKPPAHLCPTTWQGWKELEESITPSTMRDEIRLIRIIIQYFDTEDAEVLDELKEWLAGMNEVQRACMAKSIFDRTYELRGSNIPIYKSYIDLYKAIRGDDISSKSEGLVKWMKKQWLIE